jgi:hypothetical protein
MAVRWLLIPPSEGPGIRIDVQGEIMLIRTVLNIGLPAAVVAGVGLAWISLRTKSLDLFGIILVIVTLGSVFGCALATWSGLVAMHEGADLWSLIWWS